jgi:hypothetical protein
VTAVWIAAGTGQREAGASFVFHFVIWFFLPLAIHLHTILPGEIFNARVRRVLQVSFYLLAAVLAGLDALFLLEGVAYSYVWSTLVAILLSIGLLCLRLFLRVAPATRVATRIMLFGVVLGLVPFVVFNGVLLLWIKQIALERRQDLHLLGSYMGIVTLVSVPILPMSYIYAIYKHHLGALEFRANRLLGVYTFSALLFASYVLIFFALSDHWQTMTAGFLATLLTVSLAYMAAVTLLRDRFQAMVDRYVFGI